MGAVYQGTQIAVGRRVAIKLLNAALKSQQEVRDRFKVEAQAIATLSHPNCVTLYDFGYSEELASLYMAVEYLDGPTLDEMIDDGLEPFTALLLSRQIADVLVVAHRAGIMHRDLKPENVMVVRDNDGSPQAKVLDFGLARIFEDASGGARLTRHGQLFGTPAYMSPEQCQSAMDVGPPSDIYALGVSMFEMLTGRLPFDSPSVPELLVMHTTRTAPPVEVNADVPLEVSALIARMLSKHPQDRPTGAETAAVLGAVIAGRTVPDLPPIVTRPPVNLVAKQPTLALPTPAVNEPTQKSIDVETFRDPATPNTKIAAGAGVLLLVVALVAVVWALSAQPSEDAALDPVGEVAANPLADPAVEIAKALAPDSGAATESAIGHSALAIDTIRVALDDAQLAVEGAAAPEPDKPTTAPPPVKIVEVGGTEDPARKRTNRKKIRETVVEAKKKKKKNEIRSLRGLDQVYGDK